MLVSSSGQKLPVKGSSLLVAESGPIGRISGIRLNAPGSRSKLVLQISHSTFSTALLFFSANSNIFFCVAKSPREVHKKFFGCIAGVFGDS
ncbi:hypothetical protein V6N12_009018 [Hibiscus sabdariffa]|uniref:Ribosomal protein L2 n=1 Tax=Hibiscus sabdariffa TaxID=183260 RepID=A0ABR2C4G8_9ROSI